MSKFYPIRLLSICMLLVAGLFGTLSAQDGNYRRAAVRFGLNSGGAWQCSDVRTIGGIGVGATLEVPIVENDHSFLGVGIRGRYLFSSTKGRDWQRKTDIAGNNAINGVYDPSINYTSQGSYFANHRTLSTNWDLELLLKANRLRVNTGIVAYLWGGVGLMGNRVNLDQGDFFGMYDYSTIGVNGESKDEILQDLLFLRDGEYDVQGMQPRTVNWRFAPSGGIGLGYEFAPWFQMVAEWKVSFPMTDALDGVGTANTRSWKGTDIHHYAGLGLHFSILGGGSSHYTPPPTDPNTYTPRGDRPAIVMVFPTGGGTDLGYDCMASIEARLYNVRNKALITFTQDGMTVNPDRYNYDPASGMFTATVSLRPGLPSSFKIVARNAEGTVSQDFTLSCAQQLVPIIPPPIPGCVPPQAYITYPQGSLAVIPSCRTVVYAEVHNVRSRADIEVWHMGRQVAPQYWDYSPYNHQLTLDAQLLPGDNRFEIVARNPCGEDHTSILLRCPATIVLPAVEIITPSITPYSSPNCVQSVVARVTGVRSRADIVVYVNRQVLPASAWSYNAQQVSMTLNLIQGQQTVVEIVATNENGQSADIQALSCYQQLPPPIVQVITPANGVYQGQDCNQRVTAKVLNVAGAQDITVTLNGAAVPASQWSYNTFNQLLVMDLQLTSGVQALVMITGRNSVGTASDRASLTCTPPVVQTITICHIPPGNPAGISNITIPEDQWPLHKQHGDVRGPCSTTNVQLCYQGQPISVSSSALNAYLSLGATQGPCQEPMITICHIPPGNPSAASTMQIPQSQWPTYQAQGSVQGACSPRQVKICYQGRELNVSETVWPVYQGLGATQGPCPVRTMVICVIPKKNPAAVQTLTIPESEWPAYQAQGAVQGPCSSEMTTICYNGQTMQISQSALAAFTALGARPGECPDVPITICHIPPGDPAHPQTITVPTSQWPSHQAHGDVQGPCSNRIITVCFNKQEIQVSETAWPALQAAGATQGPCPQVLTGKDIQICHIPPENPAGAQTMMVSPAAWPGHQAHGDVTGPCSTEMITVCFNGRTIQVSATALNAVLAAGATRGPCEPTQRDIQICHIPPGNPANPQTLTVPAAAWPAHQAHGDVQGPCSPQTVTVCYNNQSINVSTSALNALLAAGATQGECPAADPDIQICHLPPGNPYNAQTLTIKQSAWPAHQAHGDVQGPCSTTMVTVCYRNQTIQVSQTALSATLAAGATEGACTVADPTITICHIPPGNPTNPQTMSIPTSAWASHQAHGDLQGACSKVEITVCYQGNTVQVSQSAWTALQAAGAIQGPCELPEITICHIPPGNPTQPQTMTIPGEAWAEHQAHGDVQGPCSAQTSTLCYEGQTIQISTSAVNALMAMGATQGACPPANITICHIPPGNPTNPQTLTIPATAWPAHQNHGDVEGACSAQTMTICYEGNSLNVSVSAWSALQSLGATQGECPNPDVTICHIPPGNPTNPQTLTVPANAWTAHQNHGDVMGPCSGQTMTICYEGNSVNVSVTAWPALQSLGATQGECPNPDVTICHIPPGNPANPQTLTVPANAWSAHQGHGDVMGPCSQQTMTVCYRGNSINVSVTAWPALQASGATAGECPSGGGGNENPGGGGGNGGGNGSNPQGAGQNTGGGGAAGGGEPAGGGSKPPGDTLGRTNQGKPGVKPSSGGGETVKPTVKPVVKPASGDTVKPSGGGESGKGSVKPPVAPAAPAGGKGGVKPSVAPASGKPVGG